MLGRWKCVLYCKVPLYVNVCVVERICILSLLPERRSVNSFYEMMNVTVSSLHSDLTARPIRQTEECAESSLSTSLR